MDYSSGWARAARRIGQKAGILRPMVKLYRDLTKVDYEAAFDEATAQRIRPGDTVWDVGANIGHYVPRFAGLCGPSGRLVAIEPSPSSLPDLQAAAAGRDNVVIETIAISNYDGEAAFFVQAEASSDNSIEGLGRESVGSDSRQIQVPVRTGDSLAAQYPPNFIKIDVEGFEVEVIEGLRETLRSPRLHTVAIEVHFLTMAERGCAEGPAELSKALRDSGFKLRWTDPSHVIATK